MQDFEYQVLTKLSDIQSKVSTLTADQAAHLQRIGDLEEYNDKQDGRQWVKSLLMAGLVTVSDRFARKLGWL